MYMQLQEKVQNFGLCDGIGYRDSCQLNDSFEKYKPWLIPQIKDSSIKCISSSFSSFLSKFWYLSIILNNEVEKCGVTLQWRELEAIL